MARLLLTSWSRNTATFSAAMTIILCCISSRNVMKEDETRSSLQKGLREWENASGISQHFVILLKTICLLDWPWSHSCFTITVKVSGDECLRICVCVPECASMRAHTHTHTHTHTQLMLSRWRRVAAKGLPMCPHSMKKNRISVKQVSFLLSKPNVMLIKI